MGLYGVTEPWFWKPFYSFCHSSCGNIPALLAALLGYLFRGVYFSILQAATIVFFNFFNGQQRLTALMANRL